jgi:hypothetical protein
MNWFYKKQNGFLFAENAKYFNLIPELFMDHFPYPVKRQSWM